MKRTHVRHMYPFRHSYCVPSSNGNDTPPAHHAASIDNSQSPYVKLRCVPMQDTRLTNGFWTKRFELAANKMLPTLEKTMLGEGTANLNRIKYAAGLIEESSAWQPLGRW